MLKSDRFTADYNSYHRLYDHAVVVWLNSLLLAWTRPTKLYRLPVLQTTFVLGLIIPTTGTQAPEVPFRITLLGDYCTAPTAASYTHTRLRPPGPWLGYYTVYRKIPLYSTSCCDVEFMYSRRIDHAMKTHAAIIHGQRTATHVFCEHAMLKFNRRLQVTTEGYQNPVPAVGYSSSLL